MTAILQLMEDCISAASRGDLPNISHTTLELAIRLVPHAEVAVLFLYDRDDHKLRMAHSIGVGPAAAGMSFEPGEGIAGRTFQAGRGAVLNSSDRLAAFASRSDHNERLYRLSTAGLGTARAGLSTPLAHQGQPLGAMVLLGMRSGMRFTRTDERLIQVLASVASQAIAISQRLHQINLAYDRLDARESHLREQQARLDFELNLYDRLSTISRTPDPIGAISSCLGSNLSSTVYILDPIYRILKSFPKTSSSLLRDCYPSSWPTVRDLVETAGRLRVSTSFDLTGFHFLVAPVMAHGDLYGYLFLQSEVPLVQERWRPFIDICAAIVGITLAFERAENDRLVWRAIDPFLQNPPADCRHNDGPTVSLAVGRIFSVDCGCESHDAQLLAVACDALNKHLTALRVQPTARVWANSLIAVWPGADTYLEDLTTLALRRAAAEVHRMAPDWRLQFGRTTAQSLDAVSTAYREALLGLAVRAHLGDKTDVFNVDDLGAYRILVQSASIRATVEFCDRVLAKALAHDRESANPIIPTFREYLNQNFSLKKTAEALRIHPHTVAYRLRRIQELCGVNLQDSSSRLTLELALRILDMSRPSDASREMALRLPTGTEAEVVRR